MTELRAMVLVTLGGIAAEVGSSFGLSALGAGDEQVAAACVLCLVATGVVGSFLFMRYSPPSDRR